MMDLTKDYNITPLLDLPNVIGLWAPGPECGKSTVARVLAKFLGYKRTAFAEPLKLMLITLLTQAGYSQADAERLVWDDKSESLVLLPGAPTSRSLHRSLGTEWGRNMVHPDLWTTIWKNKDRLYKRVVDDVRVPNEYSAVRTSEGKKELWGIIRPGFEDTSGHHSESGLGPEAILDRVIYNDGDLEALTKKLYTLTKHFIETKENE